jgi:predicted RNase H-like nuclease
MQFPHNNLRSDTMNVPTTIDAGVGLSKYLEGANGDTDMVRSMLGAFADEIMSAPASMQCNAAYNERSVDRENSRRGFESLSTHKI